MSTTTSREWVSYKKLLSVPTQGETVFIRYNEGKDKEVGTQATVYDLYQNGWDDVEWLEEKEVPATDHIPDTAEIIRGINDADKDKRAESIANGLANLFWEKGKLQDDHRGAYTMALKYVFSHPEMLAGIYLSQPVPVTTDAEDYLLEMADKILDTPRSPIVWSMNNHPIKVDDMLNLILLYKHNKIKADRIAEVVTDLCYWHFASQSIPSKEVEEPNQSIAITFLQEGYKIGLEPDGDLNGKLIELLEKYFPVYHEGEVVKEETPIEKRMTDFFANVRPEYLISQLEEMGYTFVSASKEQPQETFQAPTTVNEDLSFACDMPSYTRLEVETESLIDVLKEPITECYVVSKEPTEFELLVKDPKKPSDDNWIHVGFLKKAFVNQSDNKLKKLREWIFSKWDFAAFRIDTCELLEKVDSLLATELLNKPTTHGTDKLAIDAINEISQIPEIKELALKSSAPGRYHGIVEAVKQAINQDKS